MRTHGILDPLAIHSVKPAIGLLLVAATTIFLALVIGTIILL